MAKGNSIKAYSLEASVYLGFDNSSLKKANTQIKREMAKLTQHTAQTRAAFASISSAAAGAVGGIAGGFAIAASAAARFEESFVAVKKTLNVGKDVKDINKAFDQIAASLVNISKVTPVTTKELNEIAAVGGQLGVTAKDIVAFTKTVQKLTVATNLGAEQAALAMARLQEITGLTTRDLDNLGASLVDLGNNFAATESEIVNASLQIATATAQIAGNLNNAAVDALAFSTALRAIGQPAQAGATAVVRLMTEASQAVELGGERLETFAKTAGMSGQTFKDLFAVDSTQALALFIKGLDDTSKVGLTNIEILQQLGLGQVRSRKAILALSKAHETLFDAIDTANSAYIENTALNIEAERRYDTLYSKIQQLKNIASAGILDVANDNNSLDAAKNLLEDITNITYVIVDNIEMLGARLLQVMTPLILIRGIMKSITTSSMGMAKAMGMFEVAADGVGDFNSRLGQYNFATGKGVKAEDLSDMGMKAFQGGRISTSDRLLAMPGMGILGSILGFQGGKTRSQQNKIRQAFFQARPGADMFMQGMDVEQIPGIQKRASQAASSLLVADSFGQIKSSAAHVGDTVDKMSEEAVNTFTNLAEYNLNAASRYRKFKYNNLVRVLNFIPRSLDFLMASLAKVLNFFNESTLSVAKETKDLFSIAVNQLTGGKAMSGRKLRRIFGEMDYSYEGMQKYFDKVHETMFPKGGKTFSKTTGQLKEGSYIPFPDGYLREMFEDPSKRGRGPFRGVSSVEFDAMERAKKSMNYVAPMPDKDGPNFMHSPFMMLDKNGKVVFDEDKILANNERLLRESAARAQAASFGPGRAEFDKFKPRVGRGFRLPRLEAFGGMLQSNLFTNLRDKHPDYLGMRSQYNRAIRVPPGGFSSSGGEMVLHRFASGQADYTENLRKAQKVLAANTSRFAGLTKIMESASLSVAKFSTLFKIKFVRPFQTALSALMRDITLLTQVGFAALTGQFKGLAKSISMLTPSQRQMRRIQDMAQLMGVSTLPQLPAGPSVGDLMEIPEVGDLGELPLNYRGTLEGPQRIVKSRKGPFPQVSGIYEMERRARKQMLSQFQESQLPINRFLKTPMAKLGKSIRESYAFLSASTSAGVINLVGTLKTLGIRLTQSFKTIGTLFAFFTTQLLPLINLGRSLKGMRLPDGLFTKPAQRISLMKNLQPQLPAGKPMLQLPAGTPINNMVIEPEFTGKGASKKRKRFEKQYAGVMRKISGKFGLSGDSIIQDGIQNISKGTAASTSVSALERFFGVDPTSITAMDKAVDKATAGTVAMAEAMDKPAKSTGRFANAFKRLVDTVNAYTPRGRARGIGALIQDLGIDQKEGFGDIMESKRTEIGKGQLDDFLDEFYGEKTSKFSPRRSLRRRMIMQGFDPEFEKAMKMSRDVPKSGIQKIIGPGGKAIKVNQGLAMSFDKVAASAGKLALTIKGLLAFFALIGAVITVIAPLIKWAADLGKEAKGLDNFKNSLREITDQFQDYQIAVVQLGEAERLQQQELDITGGKDGEVYKQLTKYIDNQQKALAKQFEDITKQIGKNFVENMLFSEANVDEGAAIKSYVKFVASVYGQTEDQVKDRIGEPIGKAIDGIIKEGKVPTLSEVLNQLLFKESVNVETGQVEKILSEFFVGTSRENFEKILLDSGANPAEVMQRYFQEIDFGGFGMGQTQIGESVTDFITKYTGLTAKARDELAREIGSGEFGKGTRSKLNPLGMFTGGDEFGDVFDAIREEIQKDFPDISDTELGKMILDVLMIGSTMEQVIGGSFKNVRNLLQTIPEDSEFMRAIGDTLTTYLDEMVTAGLVTEDTVLKAQGNVQQQLGIYQSVSRKIRDEELEARKELEETYGIHSEMALRFAAKVKEAFKQIRASATELGKPLEEAGLTDRNFGQIISDLRANRMEIEQYEKDIALLRARGYEFVADRALDMGLGGRDLARRALEDQSAATLMELELMRTAPDLATEVGVTSPLVDDKFMAQMETIGLNVSAGLIQGLEMGHSQVMAAFGNLGEDIIEALKKSLAEKSPSRRAAESGVNFGKGIIMGLDSENTSIMNAVNTLTTGIITTTSNNLNNQAGKNAVSNYVKGVQEGLEDQELDRGSGVVFDFEKILNFGESIGLNPKLLSSQLGALMGSDTRTGAEMLGQDILRAAKDYVEIQQNAFGAITAVTSAERARNSALLATMQTKASLAEQMRRQADIQDRINETQEKLNKLEIEGRAGNVTQKERIGILQQLLSLRDMEKRAAGEYDARTALNIQEKEQEVHRLAKMYNNGVISALELQAAQEELSEMKGEFKTAEDKELFFLQLADAESTYTEMQKDALKVDGELISTREQYFKLLDEQEQMTMKVKVANDSYEASVEGAINAEYGLQTAMLTFQENVDSHIEGLNLIDGAYSTITSSVDGLIDSVKNYDTLNKSIFGPDGYMTTSTGYNTALGQGFEQAIQDIYTEALVNVDPNMKINPNSFRKNYEATLKEFGLSNLFDQFVTSPDQSNIFAEGQGYVRESTGRYFDPITETMMEAPKSKQFLDQTEFDAIKRRMTAFAGDAAFSTRNQEITQLVKNFLESLGLNIFSLGDGTFEYFEKNLKMVEEDLGGTVDLKSFLQTVPGTFMGIESRTVTDAQQESKQNKVESGVPDDTDNDVGGPVDTNRTPGSVQNPYIWNGKTDGIIPGAYYKTQQGTFTGRGLLDSLNAGLNITKISASSGGYNYIPGMKMGGRIPDMSHLKPKKFAHGGRMGDHMMKRALVGEYGPEEVRFVPGSGFLVKPLTAGGRGNNTTVHNLSVNVTGVPVDNASARKAAIQIKKALTKLEREGNAGGGVRRT